MAFESNEHTLKTEKKIWERHNDKTNATQKKKEKKRKEKSTGTGDVRGLISRP